MVLDEVELLELELLAAAPLGFAVPLVLPGLVLLATDPFGCVLGMAPLVLPGLVLLATDPFGCVLGMAPLVLPGLVLLATDSLGRVLGVVVPLVLPGFALLLFVAPVPLGLVSLAGPLGRLLGLVELPGFVLLATSAFVEPPELAGVGVELPGLELLTTGVLGVSEGPAAVGGRLGDTGPAMLPLPTGPLGFAPAGAVEPGVSPLFAPGAAGGFGLSPATASSGSELGSTGGLSGRVLGLGFAGF